MNSISKSNFKVYILVLLFFCSVFLFYVDIMTGFLDIGFLELLKIIFSNSENAIHKIVILDIRIPVALMAIVVGCALSLSGCLLQTILNNPLASPFSLGASAAAGFGASLSIVFGILLPLVPQSLSIAANAFVFTLLSSLIIYFVSSLIGGKSSILILIGIAIFFAFQSLLSAVQYFASPEESQNITFWLFGSLSKADYLKVSVIFITSFCCFIFALKNTWILTSFRLGEERAEALGIKVKKFRLKIFIVSSFLTAVAVSFAGIIGFIGLISPHIGRILLGEDHRFLIPCSMLIGAILLQVASIVSKILIPGAVFPVGIVTAIFGVPFFSKKKIQWN